MLTRLQIRKFKVFSDADIDLGPVTVLCGPNNSGKTAALQAIALWQLGLKAWQAERGKASTARVRVGVPINCRDLVSVPDPETSLLWHGLKLREGFRQNGHTVTRNLRIDITVSSVGPSGAWECGLEFDYSGPEVIYVRPRRLSEQPKSGRMPVPDAAGDVRVALLPAMSGLAAIEPKMGAGACRGPDRRGPDRAGPAQPVPSALAGKARSVGPARCAHAAIISRHTPAATKCGCAW